MKWRVSTLSAATIAGWLSYCAPVIAGPPYVTDDPEPTDLGHWEDYLFVLGTVLPGSSSGQVGVELNYGAANDLQLSVTIPTDYDNLSHIQMGSGDVLIGAKYRFVHQTDADDLPEIAFYPQLSLPTASRQFGTQYASLFLPLWAQRDIGAWTTFGGFGYDINPGGSNKNYWLLGWAVTRNLTDRLNLGVEIYHQTTETIGGRALTNIALGVTYQLTKHFSLMASGGPGLKNTREMGQYAFYASMQLLY